MLRVLTLGLPLPQSTPTALSFRVLTWDLPPLQSLKFCSVRLLSDFSTRFPDPVENEDQDEDDGNASPSYRRRPKKPHLKILQTPIRPLRPTRPPPKYAARSPEHSEGLAESNADVQYVLVHPKHQGDDTGLIPPTGRIILENSIPLPDSQLSWNRKKRKTSDDLLRVLTETQSIDDAWNAYCVLRKHSPRHVTHTSDASHLKKRAPPDIPYSHLHRFARLLASTKPRTRTLFHRLLSVLTTIHDTGGTIYTWEWNALIDCAGKGWRKTTLDDYRSALNVFKDMVVTGQNATSSELEDNSQGDEDKRPVAQPDIVTFTTLLYIASRSLSRKAMDHATSLLDASELPWNRITHISRLHYFIHTKQLHYVRGILQTAVDRGLDLDTLNGCMWAYARCGRLRVALEVYELLKRNIPAQDRTDFRDADVDHFSVSNGPADNPILDTPQFVLPDTMRPDKITYTLLIQALCYQGDFVGAVSIFRDMISTVDPTSRYDHHPAGRPPRPPRCFKPTLTVYRSIFLGFSRHAHKKQTFKSSLISTHRKTNIVPLFEFATRLTPSDPSTGSDPPHKGPDLQSHWTLENLEALFKSFLDIGWDGQTSVEGSENLRPERPSERMIYWIMIAYAKTTARDVGKMAQVWRTLDARFRYREDGVGKWTGRLIRFGKQLEDRYRDSDVVAEDKNTA